MVCVWIVVEVWLMLFVVFVAIVYLFSCRSLVFVCMSFFGLCIAWYVSVQCCLVCAFYIYCREVTSKNCEFGKQGALVLFNV